jgi:hypothetical protein
VICISVSGCLFKNVLSIVTVSVIIIIIIIIYVTGLKTVSI